MQKYYVKIIRARLTDFMNGENTTQTKSNKNICQHSLHT